MKKIFFCAALLSMCLFATPAYASSIVEQGSSVMREDNVLDGIATEDEVQQLEKSIEEDQVSSLSYQNVYEPNNTIETAFPYSQMDRIKCNGDKDGSFGHYNCFYQYTFLETEDDLDFFKVNVQTGFRYVVALKNVWLGQIRDIRLYYKHDDGTWHYKYTDVKSDNESLFHFTPDKTTYYVRISGSAAPGYSHDTGVNWFAVERDGTIDERLQPYAQNPSHALQSK